MKTKMLVFTAFFVACAVLCAIFIMRLFTPPAYGESVPAKTQDYYMVSAYSSYTQSDAVSRKSDIINRGGAGFIFERGSRFYVLVSCYLSQKDAQNVASNLSDGGYKGEIINITLPKSKLQKTAPFAHEVFKNINNFFWTSSIDFDKGILSRAEVLSAALPVVSEIDEACKKLNDSLNESEVRLRMVLRLIKDNIQLLTIEQNGFSQFFKYTGLNCLVLINNYING